MAASDKVPTYVGWYRPHKAVDWDGLVVDRKTGELVKEPSMTRQEFVAECDINNIVKEYQVTGIFRHINEQAQKGAFLDLPEPMDYQQALQVAIDAQAAFAALPSKVRNRFENDPQQFLEFLHDPANQEEAVKLGLANAPPVPPTPTASPAPTPEAPPPAPSKGSEAT